MPGAAGGVPMWAISGPADRAGDAFLVSSGFWNGDDVGVGGGEVLEG